MCSMEKFRTFRPQLRAAHDVRNQLHERPFPRSRRRAFLDGPLAAFAHRLQPPVKLVFGIVQSFLFQLVQLGTLRDEKKVSVPYGQSGRRNVLGGTYEPSGRT